MAGAIGRITLVGILGFVIMLVSATDRAGRHPGIRRTRHSRPYAHPQRVRCSTGSAPRGVAATTTSPDPPDVQPRPRAGLSRRAHAGPTSWRGRERALCRQVCGRGSRRSWSRATRRRHRLIGRAHPPHTVTGTAEPELVANRADPVTRPRTAPAHASPAQRRQPGSQHPAGRQPRRRTRVRARHDPVLPPRRAVRRISRRGR